MPMVTDPAVKDRIRKMANDAAEREKVANEKFVKERCAIIDSLEGIISAVTDLSIIAGAARTLGNTALSERMTSILDKIEVRVDRIEAAATAMDDVKRSVMSDKLARAMRFSVELFGDVIKRTPATKEEETS